MDSTWNYITEPKTKIKYSINSPEGQKLLQIYFSNSEQVGGGRITQLLAAGIGYLIDPLQEETDRKFNNFFTELRVASFGAGKQFDIELSIDNKWGSMIYYPINNETVESERCASILHPKNAESSHTILDIVTFEDQSRENPEFCNKIILNEMGQQIIDTIRVTVDKDKKLLGTLEFNQSIPNLVSLSSGEGEEDGDADYVIKCSITVIETDIETDTSTAMKFDVGVKKELDISLLDGDLKTEYDTKISEIRTAEEEIKDMEDEIKTIQKSTKDAIDLEKLKDAARRKNIMSDDVDDLIKSKTALKNEIEVPPTRRDNFPIYLKRIVVDDDTSIFKKNKYLIYWDNNKFAYDLIHIKNNYKTYLESLESLLTHEEVVTAIEQGGQNYETFVNKLANVKRQLEEIADTVGRRVKIQTELIPIIDKLINITDGWIIEKVKIGERISIQVPAISDAYTLPVMTELDAPKERFLHWVLDTSLSNITTTIMWNDTPIETDEYIRVDNKGGRLDILVESTRWLNIRPAHLHIKYKVVNEQPLTDDTGLDKEGETPGVLSRWFNIIS
mgnify:CR=1 FL=1|tara:strand:- start:1010 stop:2689 length:1680 start_codon:yes stop_codon:yes gene_type:complete